MKITLEILSFLFQIGGAITLAYFSNWESAVCILFMFCGHNIERHYDKTV